eukprot:CAMPEP_0196790964 /NCGR_PEP_ID=MMETSP1104-20130614/29120_1 /TAXON_ID=33652 /ORGANISM="Cafeteria sp., Strain Caron Lab Isolate" /LENGTH=84 /DNA_ID=CAMNT_0042161329 /DNA_START=1 /DNA_END=252 /DNA_ORIENTATION=-
MRRSSSSLTPAQVVAMRAEQRVRETLRVAITLCERHSAPGVGFGLERPGEDESGGEEKGPGKTSVRVGGGGRGGGVRGPAGTAR